MKHNAVVHMTGQLETSNGKYARIESKKVKGETIRRIVAKRDQVNQSKVTFYQCSGRDRNVWVTFSFEVQNKKYFPVAKRQTVTEIPAPVEVKPLNVQPNGQLDEIFLFRWTETKAGFTCLNSVADPSQYLFVHKNQFTLSSTSKTHFKVKMHAK